MSICSVVFLMIASALVFALAGVLTKANVADAWTIACWRRLVGGLLIAANVAWLGRDRPPRHTLRLGWQGSVFRPFRDQPPLLSADGRVNDLGAPDR